MFGFGKVNNSNGLHPSNHNFFNVSMVTTHHNDNFKVLMVGTLLVLVLSFRAW